jgi:uncharacterized membrane protein YgcG
MEVKLVVIGDTAGAEREAYLDRLLEQWGWPESDQLLLVVYTRANHEIRFAMGSALRTSGVSVSDMVDLIHSAYEPEVRKGDPAH